MVALRAPDLPRDRPPRALEGVDADDGGQQRRPHHLAAPGALALEQRREHAVDAGHPGEQVGDGRPDALGVVRPGAGDRHEPGLALRDLVVAGAPALGAVVPEAGDRQDDEARVELEQPRRREAEPVEHARAEVLEEHVRPLDERREVPAPVVALEVERHRLLAAVARHEVRRLPVAPAGRVDEGRAPPAGVVARARGLDLDDAGAEVGEHHAGVRPGEGAGQVDDEGARERAPARCALGDAGLRGDGHVGSWGSGGQDVGRMSTSQVTSGATTMSDMP